MNRNNGFTLIEVLVSTVILAVGLLGLAGLQVNSLKNNQSAYMRTQAAQLAYDIADRMRSNAIDASTLGASVYSAMPPGNAVLQGINCTTVGGVCTPATMAQHDLAEWNNYLINVLPLGTGSIVSVGNIYTITINWDDNKDGCVNPEAIPTAACAPLANDPNFQMSFQL